jgi:glycosyltransferase involved in cell wall biosynthesis
MLLKTGSVPRESGVLLFFPNLPIRLDDAGKAHWNRGPTTKLMAWLFGQLSNEVESGRVVLGVETHAMRRALESLIQIPVVYLPHPVEASTTGLQVETTNHTNLHERGRQGGAQGTCAGASEPGSLASKLADLPVSESPTRSASAIPCFDPRPSSLDSRPKSPSTSYPPPATSAKPIVFGCYGAARWEKGSDIFLKAIRLVLDGVISTTKCTKGHEKVEGISTTDNSDIHGWGEAGLCLDEPSGAAFSNPSTSVLARDSENISPSRSASAPADALRADHTGLGSAGGNQLADSKDFLKGYSHAGLQMDNQKDPTIRTANDPSASGEYSSFDLRQPLGASPCGPTSGCSSSRLPERSVVSISEICGQNSSSSETSHSALDSSLAATAAGRPLRFAIQWVEDFQDGEGNQVSIDPWLKNHSQVEVFGRYFEGDEYERRLAETDVMVLPYRSPYRLRVSRVVIEAMMNGMPVVATRGTTLFEQAEEYGVVLGCEDGDAESLAKAMLEVAARFESLRLNAEEKASAAAESFSVGYFRDLLGRDGQKLSTLDAGPSSLHFK